MNINQSNFKTHDTYKKDEKKTTNFELVNNDDVINKAYLEEKVTKIHGHLSLSEKNYREIKL